MPRGRSRLLKLNEVLERTSLSKSGLYRKMEKGEFPGRVQVGSRGVAWHEFEVEGWIATRPRQRRLRQPRKGAQTRSITRMGKGALACKSAASQNEMAAGEEKMTQEAAGKELHTLAGRRRSLPPRTYRGWWRRKRS